MIEPIEIEIRDLKFRISKFPATVGREIISKYPISNMPKIGDYKVSEETMLMLMKYVERVYEDRSIALANKALIDNHVPDWEVLTQLEAKMIEYNCSFFQNGKGLNFLTTLTSLADKKVTEILTVLLDRLLPREKQPSTNSEQSIH